MVDYSIIPSFGEFEQIPNKYLFDSALVDSVKKDVEKIGIPTWEEYLRIVFHNKIKPCDFDGLVNELISDFENEKYEISMLTLIDKYTLDFKRMGDEYLNAFNNLSTESIENFKLFENQLRNYFVHLIFSTHPNKKLLHEFSLCFAEDINNQINAEICFDDSVKYFESLSLNHTKKYLSQYQSDNFYFPKKAFILNDLHDELVRIDYIEPNSNFEALFKNKIKLPELKPIQWKSDPPKLAYLLYRLNDCEELLGDLHIWNIAEIIFEFNKVKTQNNIRVSISKVVKRFNEIDYLLKKHKPLKIILDKLIR